MVIDKTAYFTVQFAKNVFHKPLAERQEALKQMPNKGVALIKSALQIMEATHNKRGMQ